MRLELKGLPIPPSQNRLHRYGQYSSYAGPEWVEWLNIARPILVEAVGGMAPDADHWWGVILRLRIATGDAGNRQKAILDWLGGSYPLDRATVIDGKKRGKGTIVKGPGLFVDDKRVRYVLSYTDAIRCADPSCDVFCRTVRPPTDERLAAEYAAREAKAAEKFAESEERRRQVFAVVPSLHPLPASRVRDLVHARNFNLSDGAVKRVLDELEADGCVVRSARGWVRL